MQTTIHTKAGLKKLSIVELTVIGNAFGLTIAETETPKAAIDAILSAQRANTHVHVTFRITQTGKSPFTMQHMVETKAKDVTTVGLARKVGYALADSLHSYAAKVMDMKAKHGGKYITSFRPKAVFTVEVSVNNRAVFIANEVKGADAIRILDGKGGLIPRSLMVDKFELLAGLVQASQNFTAMIEAETATTQTAAENTPETAE